MMPLRRALACLIYALAAPFGVLALVGVVVTVAVFGCLMACAVPYWLLNAAADTLWT